MRRVVVVGAGHAGFHTAFFLRSKGWTDEIVLIDTDSRVPYQRPPLSKEFLWGKQELEDGVFRPDTYYLDEQIELISGHQVTAIERPAKQLILEGHAPISYDHLVLATGSVARKLSLPGGDLDGVHNLATAGDAAALRSGLASAQNVVVIGGGFIGLESAAMAASAGKRVVVFEAANRLMARAISQPMSEYFEKVHRAAGIDLRIAAGVNAVEGIDGRVRSVVGSDATQVDADLVVVGIGADANEEFAAKSGLATDRGILVDEFLKTTDPNISAIGDCARFPLFAADGSSELVRLESVQNATDQARFVAHQIMENTADPYRAVPWFWTEQFGRKLQIAGLVTGYNRTELESTGPDNFSIHCYHDETLLGTESVNAPRDHMRARKELTARLKQEVNATVIRFRS
ncbi:NAD(P)/FAD-dependent oxidoreductase [Rhodococcus globerulus]|uniref:FAD-dependent oxidoreductase n=1 Tax=Rhodococcus globerulus TaxID=33008 RepID=A0ABU4C525_RHOGO|nr:FAD-dependent oxidoreductase [Rhodococcus globerulus]MDV6271458.1 FAD-dependent oxidoreductase [Rhodococcus globerulus]